MTTQSPSELLITLERAIAESIRSLVQTFGSRLFSAGNATRILDKEYKSRNVPEMFQNLQTLFNTAIFPPEQCEPGIKLRARKTIAPHHASSNSNTTLVAIGEEVTVLEVKYLRNTKNALEWFVWFMRFFLISCLCLPLKWSF